jgi:hypothetical protein
MPGADSVLALSGARGCGAPRRRDVQAGGAANAIGKVADQALSNGDSDSAGELALARPAAPGAGSTTQGCAICAAIRSAWPPQAACRRRGSARRRPAQRDVGVGASARCRGRQAGRGGPTLSVNRGRPPARTLAIEPPPARWCASRHEQARGVGRSRLGDKVDHPSRTRVVRLVPHVDAAFASPGVWLSARAAAAGGRTAAAHPARAAVAAPEPPFGCRGIRGRQYRPMRDRLVRWQQPASAAR